MGRLIGVLACVAGVAAVAAAAPPNEYACDPGRAKKGVGCECPAGYVDGRDVGEVAVCIEKKRPPEPPKPPDEVALAKAECAKVDAPLVLAFGADLAGDEAKAFRAAFGTAVVERCVRSTWHKDARRCFAAAKLAEAAHECIEKLPPVERSGIDADAARTRPVGAAIEKDQIRTRGAIVFATTTAQMSDASRPQVEAVAKVLLANRKLLVEVQVHSDNGKDAERLAPSRAVAVRAALVGAGVPAARVTAKGYGAERPAAANETAWGRARNRRVTFALVTGPDRDRDGIPDAADLCPDVPENYNGYEDDDGCLDDPPRILLPRTARLTVEVRFAPAGVGVMASEHAGLGEVVRALRQDPTMQLRVVGHADATEGDPDRIAQGRAEAVRDHLVRAGVDARRLVVKGVGATQPVDPGTTAAARAKNRFVEFVVVTN